jgi:hypothetical protein
VAVRGYDDSSNMTEGAGVPTNGVWTSSTTESHVVLSLSGKTKAQTNSYTVGYRNTSGAGSDHRVSAVWANVEWLETTTSIAPVESFSYVWRYV